MCAPSCSAGTLKESAFPGVLPVRSQFAIKGSYLILKYLLSSHWTRC